VNVNEGTHNVLREDFAYTEQNTSEVADAGEVTDAGTYLSSSSYKPGLARASFLSHKSQVTLTLK
jgi:hypothetical protein